MAHISRLRHLLVKFFLDFFRLGIFMGSNPILGPEKQENGPSGGIGHGMSGEIGKVGAE